MRLRTIFLLTLSLAMSCSPVTISQANEKEQHEEEGHHEPWGLALFVGTTRGHGENHPTLGLDLSYHLNENWSVGGVIERADREKESTLLIAGVGWHPHQRLELQLGAGRKDPAEKRENMARVALTYRFPLKNSWFLAPYIARDFIEHEEDEDVFGLYLGKSF